VPRRSISSIAQTANDLLAELGIADAPVPVERIAKHLGIQVKKTDLGSDCSGVLIRSATGAAHIGIHLGHHPNRQRFSIAHELGHYKLHKKGTYIDNGVYALFRMDSGSGTDVEEWEANQFAAALLMPKTLLAASLQKLKFDLADDEDLIELAKTFEVSTQAMAYRLGNLGLLQK
jgi:Zn-dependent peptidase ImmA (M78 family)